MSSSGASDYTPDEVRALVENYVVLREYAEVIPRRLWIICVVADLKRGFSRLEPEHSRRLFHHGVCRASFENNGTLLRRYEESLVRLTTCLNGGLN